MMLTNVSICSVGLPLLIKGPYGPLKEDDRTKALTKVCITFPWLHKSYLGVYDGQLPLRLQQKVQVCGQEKVQHIHDLEVPDKGLIQASQISPSGPFPSSSTKKQANRRIK